MAARYIVLLPLFLMTSLASASAQTTLDPISYTLSFSAPHTHYVEVRAVVPTDRQSEIDLMMAVWTPGSYLVREYARHVEALSASAPDGRVLAVEKSDKNRWRVKTGGAPAVTLSYRVYAREMSVRTNWVEAGFAMLNGAPTFITLAGLRPRPHEVIIEPAPGWTRSLTSLPEAGGGAHRYRAPDFDTLVDSPIVIGNPVVYEFEVDGKKHYLVNQDEGGVFDGARAVKDLETIVKEHRRMWGALPYDKYLFLNMITEAGGGIEHKNSTLLMTNRWATRTRRGYLNWLGLASHELFHAWNGKRLRPVELGPFDYEHEVLTRGLWIAEGITEYYGELLLHRAGLSTLEEYLEGLSNTIDALQTTPGRLLQTAEQASFDAWIRYYRPDENSVNVSISYYTKGAVIGFVLDARIRQATGGAKSLDDVMRAAYRKYSDTKGYTLDEVRALAEEAAGVSLHTLWDAAANTTSELDYNDALRLFGLRFKTDAPQPAGKAWLGVTTRNDAGRLLIAQVRRGTPAFEAGLNVDDEILAIGDYRVRADRFDNRLEQYTPGEKVSMLVARREQLMRLDVTFGTEPPKAWRLEADPASTAAQKRELGAWLRATSSPG